MVMIMGHISSEGIAQKGKVADTGCLVLQSAEARYAMAADSFEIGIDFASKLHIVRQNPRLPSANCGGEFYVAMACPKGTSQDVSQRRSAGFRNMDEGIQNAMKLGVYRVVDNLRFCKESPLLVPHRTRFCWFVRLDIV